MGEIVITTNHNRTQKTGRDIARGVGTWASRYGQRHRMRRVDEWPRGIDPPKKVRVYLRGGHFLLQWWDPTAGKNLSERVDGDVVDAVTRAREVERRLVEFKSSGRGGGVRLTHDELVTKFLDDLNARADAGEVQPRTVVRYGSALGHYLAFAAQPKVQRRCRHAGTVDRPFALDFATFLNERLISPNGSAGAAKRRMKGTAFVWDTARTLFQWAADPDRGNLLGDGFRNPFLRRAGGHRKVAVDPFGEPDVTVEMAKELIEAADDYQLKLLAPVLFYGLRPSELCFLFRAYAEGDWLKVPCNEALGYVTKGRRDKRLPLFEPLTTLMGLTPVNPAVRLTGLLYLRRGVVEQSEPMPPLLGDSPTALATELERRCVRLGRYDQATRQRVRDQVLKDAGGITYDRIEGEFRRLAKKLEWPKAATLKDLRHLFATTMSNAGMPEPARQYLMGHAPSSGSISAYTHLNRLHEQYLRAVETEWAPLLEALRRRCAHPSDPTGARAA